MNVWRRAAAEHLWMHFSRMGSYAHRGVPTIVRGEGARIWDAAGKQYLDGLAGLFVVQVGHGRVELAEAAYKQAIPARVLPTVVLRSPVRDRARRTPRRLHAW